MTVRIPIQADPSDAMNAVAAIKAALRGMGDEGRALADTDFNKILGMDDLLANIGRVRDNLQDLARVGRGETATAARTMFGRNPGLDALYNLEQEADRRFPEPASRNRFVRSVGSYALRGTAFDPAGFGGEAYGPPRAPEEYGPPPPPAPAPPPPPGPPPPPAPPPAPGGEALDGLLKGAGALKNGLLGGMGFFLAQAGLSSITGAASAAMQAGEGQNTATDGLLRRMGDLDNSFDDLRHNAEFLAKGMQVSTTDMLRFTSSFVSASGITTTAAARSTRLAVGLAESFGSDPGSMVHGMGHASFLGIEPGRFAAMVGESAVRGSMGGRVEEVMGALLHWTENASRISGSRGALDQNVAGFSDLWTSMQASGNPMFRGSNGTSVIDQLNGAITAGGGGGMAGQVLTTRAMMKAGITDPYAIQMQLAGGAFGRVKDGRTNYEVVKAELEREYGKNSDAAAIAAGTLFNMNPLTARALGKLGGGKNDYARLDADLRPYGGIDHVTPTAIRDIIAVEQAKTKEELNKHALTYLAPGSGYKMTGQQGDAIRNAKTTEDLRKALIDGLAHAGMPETDASRAIKAEKELQDQMAGMGRVLENTMTPLNQHLADLLSKADPLFEWAANQLRPDVPIDPTDGAPVYGMQTVQGRGINSEFTYRTPTGLQDITPDAHTGILSLFGHVESGMGSQSPNVFGLIDKTWTDDLRLMALRDPKIAKMIEGKSDADLLAMRNTKTTADYALQQQVAAFQLQQERRVATHQDPLGLYAVHHFWKRGNDIMDAARSTPMESLIDPAQYKANPYLHGWTAGQWRDHFRSKGLSGTEFGDYGPQMPQAVHHEATIHVKVDVNGKTSVSTHSAPLKTSGTPTPAGVAPKGGSQSAADKWDAMLAGIQPPASNKAAVRP